ncbi:protein piccolo-like isoform X2 [Penaeus indicus]|uniref:protein piccolo-like isoform X2 n=1 Tax=Penaeus indicus TaxID=29960 RepID=UPI00300C1EBD
MWEELLSSSEFINTRNPTQDGGTLQQEAKKEELGGQTSGTKEIITRSLSSQGKLPDANAKNSPPENESLAAEMISPPPKPPRTFIYTSPESTPSNRRVVRPASTPPQPPRPSLRRTFENPAPTEVIRSSNVTPPRHHESRRGGNEPNRTPEDQQPTPGVSPVSDSNGTASRPLSCSTPTSGTNQEARPQPRSHRRLGTFVLPPLPSQPPPLPPTASQRRSSQPNSIHNNNQANSANQTESRSEAATSAVVPRRPGQATTQEAVITPGEFECCCKEVFSRGKKARAYMENGRYMEAANEYQKALSVVDKVLKTQVLSITTDETTRQKFFQMQSAVFLSRKEALNGFSDAQAAVAAPREMLAESTTPGAPPTYDDVIREDQQRTSGLRPSIPVRPPSIRPSGRQQPPARCPQPRPPQPRQPQEQPAPPSVRTREPQSLQHPSRDQPRPHGPRRVPNVSQNRSTAHRPPYDRSVTHPAHDPPSHSPSRRPQNPGLSHKRSLSLTDGDLRTEMLVDLSDDHQLSQHFPSRTTAPVELRPLVPARMSYPRPKSHYPPRAVQEVPVRPSVRSRPKSCIQPGDLSPLSNISFQLPAGDLDLSLPEPNLQEEFDPEDKSAPRAKDGIIAANSTQSTTNKGTEVVEHLDNKKMDNECGATFSESQISVPKKCDSIKLDETTKPLSLRQSLTSLSDNSMGEEDTTKAFVNAQPNKQPAINDESDHKLQNINDRTDHKLPNANDNIDGAFDDLAQECDISSSVESDFEKLSLTEGENKSRGPSDLVSGSPSITSKSPTEVLDPFADIDPFASFTPKDENDKYLFPEEFSSLPITINKDAEHKQLSLDVQVDNRPHRKVDRLHTPLKPIAVPGDKLQPHDSKTAKDEEEESRDSFTDEQRETLLDALDFAISQTPGHARVSPQRSNSSIKASRCRSEDTLLDCSYNTLGMYLQSANICASRASIIDEFDPLSEPSAEPPESIPANSDSAHYSDGEDCPDGMTEEDIANEPYYAEPRKLLREMEDSSSEHYDEFDSNFDSRNITEKVSEVSTHYSARQGNQHIYANARARYSVSSSAGSWASSASSSPPPLTPFAAESWTPWEPEPLETGVGRSKFYSSPINSQVTTPEPVAGASASSPPIAAVPPSPHLGQGSFRSDSRELLRIREGVKIFFIHDDSIVTSPWNRPYLSILKDTKKTWLIGEGLTVFVGDALWRSALSKKSTLVLRTENGVYLFQETAGKPDCRAVGVRVPTTVRRAQHELFARIIQENARLEDERPSGITKAISKGASSAASKMEQMAMNKTDVVTNPPFVRRNSIRALKGVSRRLHAIAERTGYTQQELPAEYSNLQEAANVLRYARTAKSIQYI